MGQALYRKYRSKSLDEIVGQEHITQALSNALKSGKISHAYLFTGPRGVGKTSIARILAHEVNKLPYEDETTHLDIIEIDAASNRRIDEIRDLRDKVHISPTSATYKVYIIDEVHMLTKEAFNALLKTLEEPPAHVIFILATTEAHKLPETIISRTQRYSFKPIDEQKAIKHLQEIAKTEKITVDPDALKLIVEHGEGSFRDSISLLDQVRNKEGNITVDDVRKMLGIAPQEAINELIRSLNTGTAKQLLNQLGNLKEQGIQPATTAKQLGETLRQQLIDNRLALPYTEVPSLLQQLLAIPSSSNPERLLEITLLNIIFLRPIVSEINTDSEPTKTDNNEPETVFEVVTEPLPAPTKQPAPKIVKPLKKQSFSIDLWPHILDMLKKRHSTLYSMLRMCQPSYEANVLILAFKFPFHQKQVNEAKNRQKLLDVINELTGKPVQIECVIQPDLVTSADNQMVTESPDMGIDTISNIFGSAEVLES